MTTKKIYLFCEAGMSTSIMVNKMMEVVKKHQMPLEIQAFPAIHAEDKVEKEKPIAILLGPQVRHLSDKMKGTFEAQGIPVGMIATEAYGMMDGERALKDVLKLIKESKKE
ncbi:PTS sugar transporter subunit IIB [Enterococcus villorum]|uniref:PTS sugar transporter subunit IIB n=2 Tax=Enterococcus villorum TaxID=112904 RepID=A0A511J3E9_9ENTE|nr:PTS sugar transporter subunit IIB [Enterococcus villorum]EOH85824.1 PTS system cellobiose-specific IIB component [Enterococcus villorum ATCC 700913]EOW78597.1 PTS system cellobiose-specific IIB component [Enterococcus villorum ATCC 700913]GEL92223.1 PTS sugar transporter subunit IIB [Enterococcus villorum]